MLKEDFDFRKWNSFTGVDRQIIWIKSSDYMAA
jgi:hypothetical protein